VRFETFAGGVVSCAPSNCLRAAWFSASNFCGRRWFVRRRLFGGRLRGFAFQRFRGGCFAFNFWGRWFRAPSKLLPGAVVFVPSNFLRAACFVRLATCWAAWFRRLSNFFEARRLPSTFEGGVFRFNFCGRRVCDMRFELLRLRVSCAFELLGRALVRALRTCLRAARFRLPTLRRAWFSCAFELLRAPVGFDAPSTFEAAWFRARSKLLRGAVVSPRILRAAVASCASDFWRRPWFRVD